MIPKAPITKLGVSQIKQRDADHAYYTESDGYKAIKAEITVEFVKWSEEPCPHVPSKLKMPRKECSECWEQLKEGAKAADRVIKAGWRK